MLHVQIIQHLHSGIYKSDGGGEDVILLDEPATSESVAFALDYADVRHADAVGCYGNIGAGRTRVELINPDTDDLPRIIESVPDGLPFHRFSRKRYNQLRESVWNGNNWISITPEFYTYSRANR